MDISYRPDLAGRDPAVTHLETTPLLPPTERSLISGGAAGAHEIVGGARPLRSIDQNIHHEGSRVNASVQGVMDQLIEAAVLAASTADGALLIHDITPELDLEACHDKLPVSSLY